MAATVTLSTTTLSEPVSASAGQIRVASTSGLTAGTRLFVDRELMSVVSLGVQSLVNVLRGVDGTGSAAHSSSAELTIGNGDQFYSADPIGRPPEAVPVSPYINVITGERFLAQGDELPAGETDRWWQKVETTYAVGALGVRTKTTNP